ncbi:Vacuolar protein sorting-associated protein, partial [Pseudoloma neurophilia]
LAYYLFQIFKYKHLQPIRPISTRTSKKDEEFIDGEIGTILDVRVHLILTTKRLVLISREANIHINEFIFVSNCVNGSYTQVKSFCHISRIIFLIQVPKKTIIFHWISLS